MTRTIAVLTLALVTAAGAAGCTVTSGKVLSKRIVGTCHELTLQNAEAQTGTLCVTPEEYDDYPEYSFYPQAFGSAR